MAVVISSSRARTVGRSRAARRCLYVRVVWELDSGSRDSSRSFWCCCAESLGRFGFAERCQYCCLYGLGVTRGRMCICYARHTLVVCPGAPCEDLQQREARGILFGSPQALDVGRLQQLGEDVCVWRAGGLRDQVRGCARGGGRLAEGEEGLEGIERLGLLHGGYLACCLVLY